MRPWRINMVEKNALLFAELMEIEELEDKLAPSGQWNPVEGLE